MSWLKQIESANRPPVYSQYGEEHYISFIFKHIKPTNKYFVDLGAWDGVKWSNTKMLRERGWLGLLVDAKDFPGVYRSFITKENILNILEENGVPNEFDLLSIDLDGNDYWILNELLTKYKPKLIVSEFNAEFPFEESKTIEYDPSFKFKADEYYGYTYGAGEKLANKYGYTIIFQNSSLNLYYLRNDLLNDTPSFKKEVKRWWNVKSNKNWINI